MGNCLLNKVYVDIYKCICEIFIIIQSRCSKLKENNESVRKTNSNPHLLFVFLLKSTLLRVIVL